MSEMETSMKTACCGYEVKAGDKGPVHANPFNGVVQCHNCGQEYSAMPAGMMMTDKRIAVMYKDTTK